MRVKIFLIIILVLLGFIFSKPVFAIPAMQQRCEPNTECLIGEYVFDNDGYTPITTDNFCQITITNPNDVVVVNNANMPDKNDGWYYYSTSTLSVEGLYRSVICCGTAPERLCIDKTFIVGTSFNNLAEKIWSYTGSALDTAGNAIAKVWSFATRSLTSRQIGTGEYIAGESTADKPTEYNIELVRKATFDFAGIADGGSTTTLVDAELDQPDDYWNNYELIMMSGSNIGQRRAISGFDKNTNTITVSSVFPYPVVAGDKYVISHEGRLVNAIWNYTNRTLTGFGTLVADIWSYPNRTLTSFGTLVADIWDNSVRTLTSRQIGTNEYIAGVSTSTLVNQIASQAQVAEIRDSQQRIWKVYLSDFGQILVGKTYRAKLWVLNYESVPTDSFATPTVTIYDVSRNIVVQNVAMTKLSQGIYEYTYNIPSSASAGIWEIEVSTEVEAGKIIKNNDYWEVESSPAQVKINSITDNTIPSISANVTITNEGGSGYEYQYEHCIVDSLENACGGGDDIDYAKAAKYINAGESWITNLGLTANNPGTYYYKVVVYWGTEKSVAIQQFNAVSETAYALTVNKTGTGLGTVTSNPIGINCGSDCAENYASGVVVTLSAAPASGSEFAGWSGACSGTGNCVVTMTEAKSITAAFNTTAPPPSGGGGGGGGSNFFPPSLEVYASADFNHDGIVNSVDFSILLYFWKTKPPFRNPYVDINKDGRVDSVDFSILLYQWGRPGGNIF
ncbi:MAG: InlB B-repeat-containing protein [Minisyncoccia bacterium]